MAATMLQNCLGVMRLSLSSGASQVKSLGRSFSWLCRPIALGSGHSCDNKLLEAEKTSVDSKREITKFSYSLGSRRTVHAAHKRFYRLNNGLWIHALPGRAKRLWRKTEEQKALGWRHVFCNKRECKVLDLMCTPYWKAPKYYVDDPYAPYHAWKHPAGHVYKRFDK